MAPDMAGLRKTFGGKCWDCGTKRKALEFAHTQPTRLSSVRRGRGMWARYCDIRRHPDRYALLCVPCHRRFDAATPAAREQIARQWTVPQLPKPTFVDLSEVPF